MKLFLTYTLKLLVTLFWLGMIVFMVTAYYQS